MLHLPILRWGQPYRSVNQVVTPHFRTRQPFVSMSQANVGLIRRDLLKQAEARALLLRIPVADLVKMAAEVKGVMARTEENARKAGVYPGEARDVRRRYRLEWDG